MEMTEYVEAGEKAAGGAGKLALLLGVSRTLIPDAKAGRKGLPLPACYKLADLIGVPHRAVAAASAMVTEKDEKVREYLRPFAQNFSKAAGLLMTCALSAMLWSAPKDASAAVVNNADVNFKLTQPAENALPHYVSAKKEFVLCQIGD